MIDDGQVSGQQLLVVGLCFICNMLDGFDITAMAVVANAVAQDLLLTPERLGWIFSFALAGMMGGAMLLAPLADIIGRRKLIVAAVIIVGISVLLTARASSLAEFALLRLIAGAGAGAMLASQATLAAEYSPNRFKALSVAVATSGYPAGAMLTSVAANFITPEYGWPGMFWFGGWATLVMGGVAWLLIPESLKFLFERRPKNALQRANKILRKLGKSEIVSMPALTEADLKDRASFIDTLKKLTSSEQRSTTLQLWAAFFMAFSTLYFLMSWIPKLIEDSGFTVADGRMAFLLFNLGAIVGIYLLGILSTRRQLSKVIATFALASAVGMVLYANLPENINVMLATIFFVGLFQQGAFNGLYCAAAIAYPTEMRSTGVGWAIGLGRLGAVLGPAVAGYLIAGGVGMSENFLIFAIPMAISAMFAWRLRIR